MLQEILGKISARERLIGIGAIVLVAGWLVGILLANVTYNYGSSIYGGRASYSANAFTGAAGGTGVGWIAVIAAVAAVVVIYLKYAPNMKITWPAPVPMILLGLAVAAGVASLLILLYTVQNMDLGITSAERDILKAAKIDVPSWPIMGYVAVAGMVGGAALMCWGAYQDWVASKAA